MSHLWMLGTEHRSSERAASSPNDEPISLVPGSLARRAVYVTQHNI